MRFPVLGNDTKKIDEKKATEMIHHAIDQGVNYFDTAYPYHADSFTKPGASEPFLAKAIKNGFRQKVYLATKLPCWMVSTREDLDKFLHKQLRRLKTECIDFYLLHALNRSTWNKLFDLGVTDFLDDALRAGKIGYAGFSFHDETDLFKEVVDVYDWSVCQIMYNYFDEHFQAGRAGLEYAARKDLPVVAMEPLRGGGLVNGLPDEARQILNEAAPGRTEVDWAFRWLWSQPEVSVVLSGMSHMDHVTENLELANNLVHTSWSGKEAETIARVNCVINELQKVNCTNCGYCMPCPEGVNIPRNFSLCNDHHMLKDPMAKVRYHRILGESEKASNCTQCGVCLEKCPQHIPIPDELEYVSGLFGG
jgi:predicted aldo/keto reductase-like oxidoreductase